MIDKSQKKIITADFTMMKTILLVYIYEMKHFALLLLLTATMLACNSKTPPVATLETTPTTDKIQGTAKATIPPCIQHRIDSLKQLPTLNPPAQVDEYDYNGEKVYGFSLGCCDMFYEVYNANCEYVCAPSGGFTGRGDGRCPDFNQNAKLIRVVWKDERRGK